MNIVEEKYYYKKLAIEYIYQHAIEKYDNHMGSTAIKFLKLLAYRSRHIGCESQPRAQVRQKSPEGPVP